VHCLIDTGLVRTESAPPCRNLLAAQSTKKFVEVSQVAASFAPKTQLLSPAQCCL
jgi:hypothetical protein